MRRDGRDRRKAERRGRFWPATLLAVGALAATIGALVLAFDETGVLSVASPAPVSTSVSSVPSAAESASTSTTVTSAEIPSTVYGGAVASTTTTVFTHAIEDPRRVVIESIGVDAELIRVGLESDGDMEVPPFGLAGWYELGPAPGAAGPAVIVAHVDSRTGPDVFYRLDELRPGSEVRVYGPEGEPAVFVVDHSETVLKKELPTERIWSPSGPPLIRLITCGGDFDRSSRHYLSNVIVYGHLVR